MKKMIPTLFLIFVTSLFLTTINAISLKAQANLEASCPSEIAQFSELFRFGQGRAASMDLNPEGTILVVAGTNRVDLYNVEGFTLLRRLEFPVSDIEIVAWSPDSSKIAAYMGPENGIAIYDVQKQQTLMVLKTNDNFQAQAHTLSWSPDSSKIAIIGTLSWRVWDTITGELLVDLTSRVTWPESIYLFDDGLAHLLAWSPDNKELAIPDGKNIAIFNTATWEREKTLTSDTTRITSLAWSSVGQLAVTGQTGRIQIWDIESEQLLSQVPIEGDHFVSQWSGDGQTLAVGGSADIYLLDVQQQAVTQTLQGHSWTVYDLDWQIGDHLIISRGKEGSIHAWDINKTQPVASLISYDEIGKPAWSIDETRLAVGLKEGNGIDFEAQTSTVRIWNTTTWDVVADLSIDDPTADLDTLTWSSNTHWLALSTESEVLVWNPLQNWTSDIIKFKGVEPMAIRNLTWSLDGNELAIVTSEGVQPENPGYPIGNVVRIWSMETQSFKFVFDDEDVLQAIPLSTSDGWTIIASTYRGIISRTSSNPERKSITNEGYLIDAVNTPDGIMVASGTYADNPQNQAIQVNNIALQNQEMTITGDYGEWGRPDVGLSPNANLLKLRRDSALYELWNVPSVTEISIPNNIEETRGDMVWSPDEGCIASPLQTKNEIAIWDVATRHSVSTLETNDTAIKNITWSPNTSMLATTGEGTITVWGYTETNQ